MYALTTRTPVLAKQQIIYFDFTLFVLQIFVHAQNLYSLRWFHGIRGIHGVVKRWAGQLFGGKVLVACFVGTGPPNKTIAVEPKPILSYPILDFPRVQPISILSNFRGTSCFEMDLIF